MCVAARRRARARLHERDPIICAERPDSDAGGRGKHKGHQQRPRRGRERRRRPRGGRRVRVGQQMVDARH